MSRNAFLLNVLHDRAPNKFFSTPLVVITVIKVKNVSTFKCLSTDKYESIEFDGTTDYKVRNSPKRNCVEKWLTFSLS